MMYLNFTKYAIAFKKYSAIMLNIFLTGEHFKFWLGISASDCNFRHLVTGKLSQISFYFKPFIFTTSILQGQLS